MTHYECTSYHKILNMDRKELIAKYPDLFLRGIITTLKDISGEDAHMNGSALETVENFVWDALISIIGRAIEYMVKARRLTLSEDHIILSYRNLPDEFVLSPSSDRYLFEEVNASMNKEAGVYLLDPIADISRETIRVPRAVRHFVNYYIEALISDVVGQIVDLSDDQMNITKKDVSRVLRSEN